MNGSNAAGHVLPAFDPLLRVGPPNSLLGDKRLQFLIVTRRGDWHVLFRGLHIPYHSQQAAIEDAAEAARAARNLGWDAEVLVQGADDRFHGENLDAILLHGV